MAKQNLNSTEFTSFFQETILDNNKQNVTDINAGLRNLFTNYNEYANNFTVAETYFVSEAEEGYPDLLAWKSILTDQNLWWWILLLNRLENPMTDIKANWIYYLVNLSQILNFINETNENNSSNNNSRIGKLVDLN